MQVCNRCGVTRLLAREHKWLPNGTIVLAADPTYRMVMMDSAAFVSIFHHLSENIGLPIDDIIVEAKRRSGRNYIDTVLTGPKGMLVRKFASAKVYEKVGDQAAILGYGAAHVEEYRKHKSLTVTISNVYYGAPMAGDTCGAFESVERCDAGLEWQVSDSTLSVHVTAGLPDREEFEERFRYSAPPTLPGNVIWTPCLSCGVPTEVGHIHRYEPEKGMITERKSGRRIVSMGMGTMNKIFNELEQELGEEVPRMIASLEKERARGVMLAKGKEMDTSEDGYLRFLDMLPVRGMGIAVSASWQGSTITVRIDNPHYESLNAALIAGFYEATTGKKSRVSWTKNTEGYTLIKVSPAESGSD